MKSPRVLLAVALVIAGALPALAQQKIDEKRPAAPDGVVEINNIAGSVKVTGWDRAEVTVRGTLWKNAERLDFDVSGKTTTIRVVLPRHTRQVEGSVLDIRVPAGSRVEFKTVSADVGIDSVKGNIEGQTVSGEIALKGAGSDRIRVSSVSGNVDVSAEAANVRAKSVSGTVNVRGAHGEVDASSVSGDVKIEAGAIKDGDFRTTSGSILIKGALDPSGRMEATSVSGSVKLELPANAAAHFRLKSFSGEITNEFGPSATRDSKYGPGKSLDFTAGGGGGASVRVKTLSGSIRLIKR